MRLYKSSSNLKNLEKYKYQLLLIIILLIALALRFYNYADWSLSNDELSALNRLRYNNINDLIQFGVKTDYHPLGVQLFLYYWVNIFGDSEASNSSAIYHFWYNFSISFLPYSF